MTSPMLVSEPVVIIGAPRSGTNLLRDLLCQAPGMETWPCDEINLIWRHGNVSHEDDAIPPECATPPVRSYIRKQFNKISRARSASMVVEKTCANSLRVGFVNRVIPEAKYVFIIRDGRDATASTMVRWRASFDLSYTLRKLRYAPLTDIPVYMRNFLANRWYREWSAERRLAWWGPRFPGCRERAQQLSLNELCALQWVECVERARADLQNLTARCLQIRYEDLVTGPEECLSKVFRFLDMPGGERAVDTRSVHSHSVGTRRSSGIDPRSEDVMAILGPTLEKLGYI